MAESTPDRMDRQYRAEEAARQRGEDPAFPFTHPRRARRLWDEFEGTPPPVKYVFEFTVDNRPKDTP